MHKQVKGACVGPVLNNFDLSQVRKCLENGLFLDLKWLDNGSQQNQKLHFFHARVRLEEVICVTQILLPLLHGTMGY